MLPATPERFLPDWPTADQIEEAHRLLLGVEQRTGVVVDLSTVHLFAGRVYGRSIVVKAGTMLVGAPHKHDCIVACVGDITVWSAECGRERITGAHVFESKAGGSRVGYAHADTAWVTFHDNPTGTCDVCEIERHLTDRADELLSRRTPAPVIPAGDEFDEPHMRAYG